jgi:hypothetical protein
VAIAVGPIPTGQQRQSLTAVATQVPGSLKLYRLQKGPELRKKPSSSLSERSRGAPRILQRGKIRCSRIMLKGRKTKHATNHIFRRIIRESRYLVAFCAARTQQDERGCVPTEGRRESHSLLPCRKRLPNPSLLSNRWLLPLPGTRAVFITIEPVLLSEKADSHNE